MAKKDSVRYVCSSCGVANPTWSGRCYSCGDWNTLQEEVALTTVRGSSGGHSLKTQTVSSSIAKDSRRLLSGTAEIDTVFGGGIVAGSINLLAGQPGIGKSTLLLQMAHDIARKERVLYVSGEESAHQIGLRAERLGVAGKNLQLATSTSAEDVATTIFEAKFDLVIVDSV